MKIKLLSLLIIISFCVVTLTSSLAAAEVDFPVTMRLGHMHAEDEAQGKSARLIKNMIEIGTGGDIQVEIYPLYELGDEGEMVEGVELGTLEMAITSEGGLAGTAPEIQVLSAPFLFSNSYVAWQLVESPFFDELQESILNSTNNKVRLIGAAENGFRHTYTSGTQVTKPEDFKGLTMRMMEVPIHIKFMESMGASVIALPAAERYSALDTGMIDGVEGGLDSVVRASLYEVTDYATLTSHIFAYHYYVINNDFFKSLPQEYQEIIVRAQKEGERIHASEAKFSNDVDAVEYLQDHLEFYQPTAEEAQMFRDVAQEPILEEIEEIAGEELLNSLLENIEIIESEISDMTR